MFPPYVYPEHTILDVIADAFLLGAAAGLVVFTLSYLIFFKFWKTFAGVSVALFTFSLDLVIGLILIGRFAGGDYGLRDELRFAVYLLVFAASWLMVYTIWHYWLRTPVDGSPSQDLGLERREHPKTGETPIQESPGSNTP